MLRTLRTFEKVRSKQLFHAVSTRTVYSPHVRVIENPDVILSYLTFDIWKIGRYAVATSVHRLIVDNFIIENF
jgi:hypothetical protein